MPDIAEPPVAPAAAPATTTPPSPAADAKPALPAANIANLGKFARMVNRKVPATEKQKPEAKLADPGDDAPSPETPKQEPAPKAEPTPAPTKPKKPKAAAPEPRQPAQPSQIDLEAVAEAAGRGAAAGVAKHAPKPAPEPKMDDDLTLEEKAKADVYEKMGEMFPTQKGLKEKYVQSLKRQSDYEVQWMKDHPGEAFDANDADHDEFFKKNEVNADDHLFNLAGAELVSDRRASKTEKAFEEQKQEMEREKQARELEPKLFQEQRKAGREYFEMLEDPDFDHSKIIGADLMPNNETLAKLRSTNELKAHIYLHHAEAAEVTSRAAFALMTGVTKFNEKDPVHLEVNKTMADFEDAMATAQPQDRLDESGREFKPWGEYHGMPAKQRGRYWTESPDQIYKVVAAKHASEAKDLYQRQVDFVEKTARSLGYAKNGSPASANPPPAPTPAAPAPAAYKPKSPAATTDSLPGPGGNGASKGAKSPLDRFGMMINRRKSS